MVNFREGDKVSLTGEVVNDNYNGSIVVLIDGTNVPVIISPEDVTPVKAAAEETKE